MADFQGQFQALLTSRPQFLYPYKEDSMSIHSSVTAVRVSVGTGALAILLAAALAAPAAAATDVEPTPDPPPSQQSSTASEPAPSPTTASEPSSDEAVSDPQGEEGIETTPDGKPVPPDNSAGAASDDAPEQAEAVVAGGKILHYGYEVQKTGYWCSAAAARIALTVRGKTVSQAELARYMHVTHHGLPNISNLRDALNHYTGSHHYQVKQWPSKAVLKSKLTADVRTDIDHGYAVVINVVRIGHAHFRGGHYATIVGYRNGGAQFAIADPANHKRRLVWLSADDVVGGIKLHRYVA
jgi:hypothetical protein